MAGRRRWVEEMSVFCVLGKKRLEGLEDVRKGVKTLDHVCVGKRTCRGLKTFFNEMSSKKQTVCRAKHLRVVYAAQT
ncbi:hypothetical protein HanIR_Chr13g0636661 [Helianthus annuus]|nr:hypothetical protein HanIR_Chr13g0636661 [Helianthus annuus]